MRHLIKGAIVAAVFILQNALTSHIEILGIAPSLMIVLATIYALDAASAEEGICYCAIMGGIMDIMWGRVFGLWTIIFVYAGVGIYFAGEYFYKHTTVKAVLLTFAATVLMEAVFFLANFTLFGDKSFLYMLFRTIIPEGAYNAILQAVLYGFIIKIIPERKRGEAA